MLKSIHRAKYILAEPDLPLSNTAIHLTDDGCISSIEPWNESARSTKVEVVDWGSAVIMPGLVNVHAHLELTALRGQLTKFQSFTDWVWQLIDSRRLWTKDAFLDSVRAGTKEALESGTTLVGDVTASGWGYEGGCGSGLRRVVFEESTALSPANLDSALAQVKQRLAQATVDPLSTPGVSPHAPYSVSSELYRELADLCRKQKMHLATHIAETLSEIQFLQSGNGEFREFLLKLGVLPKEWKPPQLSPIRYLDSLGILGPSSILIHCNYLDPESINRIAATQSKVVYCPRSHDFFGHDPHPVRRLLDSGIQVALGTDSLASNSSLSMLDEMRHLFRTRQDLKPKEIFNAATRSGAAVLGFGQVLGRLQPGYGADLAVLRLPEPIGPGQLAAQVLEGAGECIGTIVQGKVAWSRPV